MKIRQFHRPVADARRRPMGTLLKIRILSCSHSPESSAAAASALSSASPAAVKFCSIAPLNLNPFQISCEADRQKFRIDNWSQTVPPLHQLPYRFIAHARGHKIFLSCWSSTRTCGKSLRRRDWTAHTGQLFRVESRHRR